MEEPIEESYFNWLCAKVLDVGVSNYYDLIRILHSTEFAWIIPNDKNREEDGRELRRYFSNETGIEGGSEWRELGCSIFELLIAFSNQAAFETDIHPKDWFWEFMSNLGLGEYRQVSEEDARTIEEILYIFIWRTYEYDGEGGLFPLRNPKRDQREVEIWYQFCEYLDDQDRL